nr:MAG TPA: hypothetical protein [Caudoviricetes sp.]
MAGERAERRLLLNDDCLKVSLCRFVSVIVQCY